MILTLKPNRFLPVASIIGIIAIVCLLMLYRYLAIESIVNHENRSNVEITHLLSDLIAHKYRDLLQADSGRDTVIERAQIEGDAVRYVDWVLPGILGMNMMFSCLFGVGYVVVRYRKNGFLKRLRATPLRAVEFVIAGGDEFLGDEP